MSARLFLRIDLTPDQRIGPGKIALLEAIRDAGSISAAGRALKMSYRRAWLLVEELNRTFAEPVVSTQAGGNRGGGAALTGLGRELVACYRELEREAGELARRRLDPLAGKIAAGPPGPPRPTPP